MSSLSLNVPVKNTDSLKLLADGTIAERVSPLPGVETALRSFASRSHCLFLDSSLKEQTLGRYSFLAADPINWIEGNEQDFDPSVIKPDCPRLPEFDLPPFRGGWAGGWGYHLNQTIEKIDPPKNDEFKLPAFGVGFYDVVLAWDHFEESAWLISNGRPETDIDARRQRAWNRLCEFKQLLNSNPVDKKNCRLQHLQEAELVIADRLHEVPDVYTNFTRQQYLDAVQKCIDYIWAGDIFQVNLSQRLLHPATTDSLSLFLQLRTLSPSPFGAYFDLGDHQVISSSPERFIQIQNGVVNTHPIKGTRQRAKSVAEDQAIIAELRNCAKDRAENTMIVDLLRNDLSKFSVDDSVVVKKLCEIESYETVHHLVSIVQSKMRVGIGFADVFKAVFPGGSITGAPKIRAMEIIAELESTSRGFYCGSLGYFGIDGQMDSNILIRTITASQGWWQFPVGGGIVAKSKPIDEYNETITKAIGMIDAIQSTASC